MRFVTLCEFSAESSKSGNKTAKLNVKNLGYQFTAHNYFELKRQNRKTEKW